MLGYGEYRLRSCDVGQVTPHNTFCNRVDVVHSLALLLLPSFDDKFFLRNTMSNQIDCYVKVRVKRPHNGVSICIACPNALSDLVDCQLSTEGLRSRVAAPLWALPPNMAFQ